MISESTKFFAQPSETRPTLTWVSVVAVDRRATGSVVVEVKGEVLIEKGRVGH
jgi:hypothetical protein